MATALGRSASPAPTTPVHDHEPATARSRRDELAIAFFGSWMLTGLYLDGWAHNADKPETFFSPWHGVLYSGFVAALLWFGVEGVRNAGSIRHGLLAAPTDRLSTLGLGLFVTGAVGDGVWHEIFGIEVDLEALLSPTHLLLLVGGFLMLATPLRAAYADPQEHAATLRSFLPAVASLTLAAALVSFFTMYLSAFQGVGTYWVDGGDEVRELTEMHGVGAILVTNLILLAPMAFVIRRWRPPFGTFTILFTGVAISMSGIDAFRTIEFVLPALLAGLAADAFVRRNLATRLVAGLTPLVLWSSYFATAQLAHELEWAAELIAGSVALAIASGLLLATLVAPEQPARS